MKDIIINGVSINQLKEQKKAIREGASEIIANSIEEGKEAVKELMAASSPGEAEALAAKALELFETAEVVSGVSGVTFEIPYSEECGNYESSDILSNVIMQEDVEEENPNVVYSWKNKESNIYKLVSLLEGMEEASRDWNSSTC